MFGTGVQFFRNAMVESVGRFGLAIRAYVWMTNHIHLLATPIAARSPVTRC